MMTSVVRWSALAILACSGAAQAFTDNGFETDWVYALRVSDSALIAMRESDGAVMKTLMPGASFSDPNALGWDSLTFSGTPSNDDARLFIATAIPRQISGTQDSKNLRISELDSDGNTVRSLVLTSLLPGNPTNMGNNVRLGTIRYSSFHRSLFVSVDPDYRNDLSSVIVYQIDLNLSTILNTYTLATNCHHDEPGMDVNPVDGTVYVCEFNLGQPDRNTLPENGQGDVIAIDTSRGSSNLYSVVIDGPTYGAADTRWANPHCPIYRGVHNPSGRPTLMVLLSGPTVAAWPQLEFFLGAPDGKYPAAGNLTLRSSPFTSQRFAWRGQLDEISHKVMATRLNQNGTLAGIDLIAPDDTPTRIAANTGWQDVDSPGSAVQPPPPTSPTGMPQLDWLDPNHFLMNGQPWYPVGYYPGLGAVLIKPLGSSREAWYQDFINQLQANGVNFFRTVFDMGQGYDWGNCIQSLPYRVMSTRTLVDGSLSYTVPVVDLNQFDDAHFAFWRGLITYARDHGVVVQLNLRESWHNNKWKRPTGDGEDYWGQRFDYYATDNNVNGVSITTENGWHDTNPASTAWQLHTALVRQCVDRLGDLPNIVWEVCNEPRPYYDGNDPAESGKTPNNWTFLLGAYLKSYELSSRGYQHVCMPIDLPDHQHTAGQKPPEHTPTEAHTTLLAQNNAMAPRQPLITDNDAPNSELDAHGRGQKAWAALTAGAHIDYFHYSMDLTSPDVSDGMRYVGCVSNFVRSLSNGVRGMVPADPLVTNGWCLARAGNEYIIYLISGGTTTVSGLPAVRLCRWYNPRTGVFQPAAGGPTFTAPDTNDWVLHIVDGSAGQTPFHASPAVIPGTIQVEDYDNGGAEVAYHDSTSGNSGGAAYRQDDVDIENTSDSGGGYDVIGTATGEWLEYIVDVQTTGYYTVTLRAAAATTGASLHLESNETPITGSILVPATGGPQSWSDVDVPHVRLESGSQVLRIAIESGGCNLNWVQFTLSARIVAADLDQDGDVDQEDFGLFQPCYTEEMQPVPPGCDGMDFDQSGTVDLFDFALFPPCLNGPVISPGC